MDWMKAGIVFTALASAILACTFFYVYACFLRRRSVLLWSGAWLAAVCHLCLLYRLVDHPGHVFWLLSQALLIANALLLVAGCFDFVYRRVPARALLAAALPFVLWAALAPYLTHDFLETSLPNALLLGGSYLATATLFYRLHRERRTQGSRLVALLLFVAGLHEFDYPLAGVHPILAPVGYALAAVLIIAIALCLLILMLEDARTETDSERVRMRAILENLPVGVMVMRPDGTLLLANDVARRVTERPLAGETDVLKLEGELFRRADGVRLEAHELPIRASVERREATPSRELALDSGKGASRTLLLNASPVEDASGHGLGAVAVFQDISDLKAMQSEAARAERLKSLGTLAAGVAHDFNNALTMILGHAELALEAADDPVVRQQISIVTRVATDAAAIVRRIQDVARSRVRRDEVAFDLAAVAREVVDIARPRWRDEAHARGLSYEVRTDLAHDVNILGQPAELREALLNLVFNALDAMPGGGVLQLTVERDGEHGRLSVHDSGIGMSAEVRARIFEPYFTTKGACGTGLGLAVVFGIVQRHDGEITVDSEPQGGTNFTLRFPLSAPPAPAPPESVPAEAAPSLDILVVDDEALVRGLLTSLLQLDGHRVVAAATGEEALRAASRQSFDLVLTDLGMPHMTGWEVAAGVRSLRPTTPVVLVTGWGETVSPAEARAKGVVRVLPKPFNRAQIAACIEEVRREHAMASS